MPKFSAYMKGGDGAVGPPGASFISGVVATTSQLPENPSENRQIYLVGESDPKHIYAYVDGVWTGQGLTASELTDVNANIASIGWTEDPRIQVSFTTNNQKDYLDFNFEMPRNCPVGFSTNQNVSVTTLNAGEPAIVEITTDPTSPETDKVFNFNFGLPRGDALSIYEGITFTSTQNGYDYHWQGNTLVFNRGTAEKLPIYIYNNNNESVASTFKISSTTIEYEADEKFDGAMYLMMPATLTDIEIGTVSTTSYEHPTTISKSTGSTSTKVILDFCISENYPRHLYGECNTAGDVVEKILNIPGFTLETGTTIFVKFLNANAIASPTLNVNNTGAIPIYRYGTTAPSTTATSNGWPADAVLALTYDGTSWIEHYWYNTTYTIYGAYCTTAASTAAKTASCTYYQLVPGYIEVTMRYTNTKAGALTLNIASKGAKPIYINGTPSSSTNYTLPGGVYIVYYDGTNYYFRTDGKIEGLCEEAPKDGKAYVRKNGAWVDITTL